MPAFLLCMGRRPRHVWEWCPPRSRHQLVLNVALAPRGASHLPQLCPLTAWAKAIGKEGKSRVEGADERMRQKG